ncbi:MAG: M3 family metallopeptidase [Ignavibacteria bacterium]|jgi:peptidyl-dipeptidase Dcp
MFKQVTILLVIIAFVLSCSQKNGDAMSENPFFTEWDTPFQTPPFDKIEEVHYLPAFKKGMEEHKKEVEAIVNNTEEPTFANTIEALEKSGALLTEVSRVFYSMTESMTNDNMQAIAKEVSPLLSKHSDDINLNPELFARVKKVYEKKDDLDLNTEQEKLLEKYYKDFVRGGANLNDADKEKFRKINEELSVLTINFGENVLKETNKYYITLEEKDLDGLPESARDMGASEAKAKGLEGKYVYTIQRPSMYPFLTYSTRRDLREKLYYGYINKGDNNDELDNKKIAARIAALRAQRANLLGYKTHADYVLEENMAKNPDNVFELLNKLWKPALKRAKQELKEMQAISDAEGNNFKLESWDWWYYAEKLKMKKYSLDEEELKLYFKLENVIDGVFGLATSLWGIQFEERKDITKYHPDVKVFEVKEKNGKHIGILYTDYFPRESKRGGAWMDAFRKQSNRNGNFITPVIYNVGNFAKPTENKPSLISVDNVKTLFHEFGHAIHGLLSNCTYEELSGTSTPRDFVEFPSQIMENWCMHPVVIKTYAKHYETGEAIPDELVEKIQKSGLHNQGFETVEYLAAALLDMYWHTLTDTVEVDADKFEKEILAKIELMPQIISRYRTTYFNHIFAGGYSAGYYSYIWAEVLDADGFKAFVETGDVLNQELAAKYRKYILSLGGTEDSMELYKKFRGREPTVEPLLAKRGLN